MVGDSATADIPAAIKAGIDSIFVDWKGKGCQQATYTAKNLAEVEQILLKS
ncbi:MAG: HAD hydrolase-like protein [Christensenellales bacterium]